MRIHGSTESGAGVVDLVNQIAAACSDAADDVGMSAEILCAGVQNEINPEFSRTLIDRRCKCTVNHADEPMLFGNGHAFSQIHNAQSWMGRRFEVQNLSIRSDSAGVLRIVGCIHESSSDTELGKPHGKKS